MAFNGALDYTAGNWKVTSLVTDSIATPKSLSLTDLDYVHDFVKTEDEPEQAKMSNITSASLKSAETLRFAKTDVKNVYANMDIPLSSQMEAKAGIRTLVEADVRLKAVNTVSGTEIVVPARAWVCIQVPTASFVSSRVMEYAAGRALSAMFSTGGVTIAREEAIARGSLLPN